MVNSLWLTTWVNSKTSFLMPGISDHSPMVLSLGKTPLRKECRLSSLIFGWSSLSSNPLWLNWATEINGNPFFKLVHKLKILKKELKKLNKSNWADVSIRAKEAKAQLLKAQEDVANQPLNSALLEEEIAEGRSFSIAARAEESFLCQKSRIQWLSKGDHCTAFFFKSVQHRVNRSKILSLVGEDGVTTNVKGEIIKNITEFFQNLLNTRGPRSCMDVSKISTAIFKRLNEV